MKKFITWAVVLMMVGCGTGTNTTEDVNIEISKDEMEVASFFGVNDEAEVRRVARQKAKEIDETEMSRQVLVNLENPKGEEAGKTLDATMEKIVQRTADTFEKLGEIENANQIKTEYNTNFKNYYTNRIRFNEIGDHDYLFEWAKNWHEKIHGKIGDKWCQILRTHDLFILNYGIPVVRAPKNYDLVEYKDHFAGHMKTEWTFVHHGVAGVVAYWAVNAACAAGTWGLGLVTFACSPIATAAEFVTDKRLAPPLAERIWNRANN
jgi:hypothetical protein